MYVNVLATKHTKLEDHTKTQNEKAKTKATSQSKVNCLSIHNFFFFQINMKVSRGIVDFHKIQKTKKEKASRI